MFVGRQSWRIASTSLRHVSRRDLSTTASCSAITKFAMPAMSPTMTEGGLATWKVKDGQSFAAGDVLLEIETDKATMDVEAQEDGVMAKIVVEAGAKAVPVGKTIAMLAEEGDDISNVEVPKDEEASSSGSGAKDDHVSSPARKPDPSPGKSEQRKADSAPPAQHAPDVGSRQLPSVSRLLVENSISAQDAKEKIKGTGLHHTITKGDVLAYLGKVSSPNGSFKPAKGGVAELGGPASVGYAGGAGTKTGAGMPVKSEPLTGNAVRSLIIGGLAASSRATRTREAASKTAISNASATTPSLLSSSPTTMPKKRDLFDELLDDYQFAPRSASSSAKGTATASAAKDPLKGLL